MLERDVSFSLYMFHGGTSFGFMNGANYSSKEPFQPDTTSYDYAAPLDEAGRPTPAYFALRKLIGKHLQASASRRDLGKRAAIATDASDPTCQVAPIGTAVLAADNASTRGAPTAF